MPLYFATLAGVIAGVVGALLPLVLIIVIAVIVAVVVIVHRRKTVHGTCLHCIQIVQLAVPCTHTLFVMQLPKPQHPRHPMQGEHCMFHAVLL